MKWPQTIRARLLAAVTVLSVLLLAIAATGGVALSSANDGMTTVFRDRVEPLRELKQVADAYAVSIVDAGHKARAGSVSFADTIVSVEAASQIIRERWAAYSSTSLTSDEQALVAQAETLLIPADAGIAKMLEILRTNDHAALVTFVEKEMYPTIDPISAVVSQIVDLQIVVAKQEFDATQSAYNTSRTILALAVLVGLAAAAFAFRTTLFGVVRPLRAIAGQMKQVSEGDLDLEVQGTERHDEVGTLSRSLEVFLESARTNRLLEAEKEVDRLSRESSAVREARQNRIEATIATFDGVIHGTLQGLVSAAEQFNASARSLTTTAESASREATTVAGAADEATINVQSVASAAEELSSSIREISRQVSKSATKAGDAVAVATQTDGTVTDLADAAGRIGAVVKLISDIARQTNLLALNATIEASRAGEAGKGFAVVAGEVKLLANQTADATEQISAQIAAMQTSTTEAVSAIRQMGGSIGDLNEIATTIAAAVEEQGAATQEIARSVAQAATGTGQVSISIQRVDQAAGEVGVEATQMVDTAIALDQQARMLRSEVDQFLSDLRAA
jgi:methyl-accepting chemotaxis protein